MLYSDLELRKNLHILVYMHWWTVGDEDAFPRSNKLFLHTCTGRRMNLAQTIFRLCHNIFSYFIIVRTSTLSIKRHLLFVTRAGRRYGGGKNSRCSPGRRFVRGGLFCASYQADGVLC